MISIVIAALNEEKYIERTLRSICAQTIPRKKYEVIVVDGGSKDNTVNIAKKYANIVFRQKSRGVGRARNEGIKKSKYDIIAITDADVVVPRNWVEKIMEIFSKNDIAALRFSEASLENSAKGKLFYTLLTNLQYLLFPLLPIMPASCTVFRKKYLNKIKGYKGYLKGAEDMDIGLRIREFGIIMFYKKMFVRLSIRRLEKMGYIKTSLIWLTGLLFTLFRRNPPIENYYDVEK